MEKQILNFVFISVCAFLLFISCSNEDNINDSLYTPKCNVTTRSTSLEWGSVRCTIKGRTVVVEWNYPTASEQPVGMLFTLRSNFYGYLYSFETFYEKMSGTATFELPTSFTFSQGDTLWLEIQDGASSLPVNLQLTAIDIDEFSGQSSRNPCNHNFDIRDAAITVELDLGSGKIRGSVGYTKRCRLIMVYSYYDRLINKTFRGYCCQDISDGVVDMNWSEGPYIQNSFRMSDITCELRLYSLSCDKNIPDSDTNFNNTGNCTNYLRRTFSFSADISQYYLSEYLEIYKQ